MTSALNVPLVVDLDGTLTPTDTLVEAVLALLRRAPWYLFCLPFWLLAGRAAFKHRVAARGALAPALLPYHAPFLDFLRAEKLRGRRIVLATAAHHSIAEGVAGHLDLFERVIATSGSDNLKGEAKLRAIRQHVGEAFLYAGDSSADLPIWKASGHAILVGASAATSRAARAAVPIVREFAAVRPGLATWVRALRVHQWLKNLLLFVPLLTAFPLLDRGRIGPLLLGLLAFCLTASATYLMNDLWDLEADRSHPRKRQRPFASGQLPILHGLAAAALAMAVALAMAATVSRGFLLIMLGYIVLTTSYSWVLKAYALVDVLMLALLYTLRIQAGSVALQVTTSSWLLAFSLFIFLSLALVKRCSELVSLREAGDSQTRGRDYRVSDLVVMWPLGVGAALCAVVVLGLFISAPDTQVRYHTPGLLWLAALGLVYWMSHLWIKTARGEMHDDPIVFALKDSGSRVSIAAIVAAVAAARLLTVTLA